VFANLRFAKPNSVFSTELNMNGTSDELEKRRGGIAAAQGEDIPAGRTRPRHELTNPVALTAASDMHSIPMSNATGEAPSGTETTTISLPVEIWFRNGTMAP
jgi:hypothetical protein